MCRTDSSSSSSTNVASVMEWGYRKEKITRKSFQSQNQTTTPVCGGGTHLETCWKFLFFSEKIYVVCGIEWNCKSSHRRESAEPRGNLSFKILDTSQCWVKVKNWKTHIFWVYWIPFSNENLLLPSGAGKWVNVFLARSECEIKMSERRRRAR